MQLVVVMAVRAAVSAAITIFSAISMNLFFSFIVFRNKCVSTCFIWNEWGFLSETNLNNMNNFIHKYIFCAGKIYYSNLWTNYSHYSNSFLNCVVFLLTEITIIVIILLRVGFWPQISQIPQIFLAARWLCYFSDLIGFLRFSCRMAIICVICGEFFCAWNPWNPT